MIEADLRTFLLAQPAVSALIGARLYPLRLPQGATLPAMTYQTVFGTSLYTHDGPADLGRSRVQLDCWADRYEGAVAVARAVRSALSGYRGPMGGNPSVAGRVINALDIPEPEPAIWRRMVEVSLWATEVS